MAKDPKIRLSDEDIVRLRDDPTDPDRTRALEIPGARRALAESRLRALAIALESKDAAQPDGSPPDDAELLEYLLAEMPDSSRRALEGRLRGNPLAFQRLTKLHELTSAHANHRDLRHADMAERKIDRHDVGRFDVREQDGRLEFRVKHDTGRSLADDFEISAYLRQTGQQAFRDVVAEGDHDDTLDRIERLLSRCRRLVLRANQLRNPEKDVDFGPGRSLKKRVDPRMEYRRSISPGEELVETMRELRDLTRALVREVMIAQEIGIPPSVQSRRRDGPDKDKLAPPIAASLPPAPYVHAFRSDWDPDWNGLVEVEAGPWKMTLVGRILPTPRLEVLLVHATSAPLSEQPFLTMVQPGKSFETADIDAISDTVGQAVLPLSVGRNIVLLQGEAVWSVQFDFDASTTNKQ